MSTNLLIIEDDVGLHSQYKWALEGYNIAYATDRSSALEEIKKQIPDIVLLDLGLPPDADNASEGLAVLSDITSSLPATKVVILTGSEQHEHALKAIELGACDFQQKGISMDELKIALERASTLQRLEAENVRLREAKYTGSALLGSSPKMISAIKTLSKIAPMPVSTLLSGESGTGKELFAKTIHDLSNRSGKFIAINCASIPKDLLESELFGHEKGAFTGAHRRKIGKVEQADGGTLFLDEIGDMPLELQSKMLRFLQEREIERVGGSGAVAVDVRVICATHCNLDKMKTQGTFREDLYFRLAEFTLKIPALRDREQDVLLLATYCLESFRQELPLESKDKATGFGQDAVTAMLEYNWPGNVRELQNRVKGALIVCDSSLISSEDLQLPLRDGAIMVPKSWIVSDEDDNDNDNDNSLRTLAEVREEAESNALYKAYLKSDGCISHAADLLGITRPTFYSLATKYNLRCRN